MQVTFLIQPDQQFGGHLLSLLEQAPYPRRTVVVSAFAALQTIMRFKYPLAEIADDERSVRLVVGVDLGGTSREALQELASWDNIEVYVYRNRSIGHTFHPKICLLEWSDHAEIFVGSNNLTEGGFFSNYEATCRVSYGLPQEGAAYDSAQTQLRRFIEPVPPMGQRLTPELFRVLARRTDIPTEAEAQRRRRYALSQAPILSSLADEVNPFALEEIEPPPPLSARLLKALMVARGQRRRKTRQRNPIAAAARQSSGILASIAKIAPAAFYMQLPKLQGKNIPGEARVPLAAIEMAEDFWGWPQKYRRRKGPRKGNARAYREWHAAWKIGDAAIPQEFESQTVRMYFCESNSDFRFYARPLINAEADLGDIVRITHVDTQDADFECVLARRDSPSYDEWRRFCTISVPNSTRSFGYG
jgi:hypothetical protein